MVTLYSTNCPKCMVLKEKLYAKHIEFTECNDTEIMKELGMTVVPVLKVNDEYLDFKAANTYINQQ
jgi:glutaredoxin-related protein